MASLKLDNDIPYTVPYTVFFAPLFLMCIAVLIVLVYLVYRERKLWQGNVLQEIMFCIAISTLLSQLIFIALKVDDYITWPWYIVMIPLWVFSGLGVCLWCTMSCCLVPRQIAQRRRNDGCCKYMGMLCACTALGCLGFPFLL